MRDGFGVEFGFDAGFTKDKDGRLVFREAQDSGDVNGGAVGRAKDFVLWTSGRGPSFRR